MENQNLNNKVISATMKKENRPAIPHKVANVLWARAAGRCEFEGCNELLCEDWLTGKVVNGSQIAHILPVANSARATEEQTEELKTDINNLMLICYKHHNLIDKSAPNEYPEERLLAMKRKHEERIMRATAVQENKQTLVVMYAANIEHDTPLLSYSMAQQALSPEYYVSEHSPIRIQLNGKTYETDDGFWKFEQLNLMRSIQQNVIDHFGECGYEHISVFALAPQALLVQLGVLLNEKYPVRTYQKIRTPNTWRWQEESLDLPLQVKREGDKEKQPVVIFALSGYDIISRTKAYYKEEADFWIVTTDEPRLDLIKTESQLNVFNVFTRKLYEEIANSTKYELVHIHMSMSNSCAIELGRTWMPKVHKNLLLFENNKDVIEEAITINNKI